MTYTYMSAGSVLILYQFLSLSHTRTFHFLINLCVRIETMALYESVEEVGSEGQV